MYVPVETFEWLVENRTSFSNPAIIRSILLRHLSTVEDEKECLILVQLHAHLPANIATNIAVYLFPHDMASPFALELVLGIQDLWKGFDGHMHLLKAVQKGFCRSMILNEMKRIDEKNDENNGCDFIHQDAARHVLASKQ